ncbi:MAG: circadian clock protein KaiB [Thermoleophilaceae bacterium]|jgi:circadian clock protein KaiB|nr:circadian clock protein KaiB [Thermoleophilaceae bacterium]
MTASRDGRPAYELTLFVSGASERSAQAIGHARQLCESNLTGRYSLTVVDVNDDAAAMLRSDVIAAPTLIKHLPLPARRLVGDLSDSRKVLAALGLPAARAGG